MTHTLDTNRFVVEFDDNFFPTVIQNKVTKETYSMYDLSEFRYLYEVLCTHEYLADQYFFTNAKDVFIRAEEIKDRQSKICDCETLVIADYVWNKGIMEKYIAEKDKYSRGE